MTILPENTSLIIKKTEEISQLFKMFHKKEHITVKDGNACVKLHGDKKNGGKLEDGYLVTISGVDKHKLEKNDFVVVNANCKGIDSNQFNKIYPYTDGVCFYQSPSIESAAHIEALQASMKSYSIHIHPIATVALFTKAWRANQIQALQYEIKSQWPELFRYTSLGETVAPHAPGSKELHEAIKDSFKSNLSDTDICVMVNHGVMAVGDSLEQATEHIERLEHVCKILLKMGF